jgi:2-polyprenyl-3-methyl-5-hydroxy-6-metoxy-1,4-benzoquinol methylase
MNIDVYQLQHKIEENHWWFQSRRILFSHQVALAAEELSGQWPLELLDYGCGSGYNLRHLLRWGRVTGAEIVDLCLQHPHGASFVRLDARTDLSEHYHRYDVVTALDVLEHIEDDAQGLKEIARFLRHSGQIVITVPAYQWLWSEHDVISHHKRRYTEKHLRKIADQAGLEVVFLSYFNLCLLPFLSALVGMKKMLKNKLLPANNFLCSPAFLSRFFYRLTSIEAQQIGKQRWYFPMGASLIARLRKRK